MLIYHLGRQRISVAGDNQHCPELGRVRFSSPATILKGADSPAGFDSRPGAQRGTKDHALPAFAACAGLPELRDSWCSTTIRRTIRRASSSISVCQREETSSAPSAREAIRCPPGWTGKGWACHQLAAAARGEYLLFTDADTVHEPAKRSAHASAMPLKQAHRSYLPGPDKSRVHVEREGRDPTRLRAIARARCRTGCCIGSSAASDFARLDVATKSRHSWRGERAICPLPPRRLRKNRRTCGGSRSSGGRCGVGSARGRAYGGGHCASINCDGSRLIRLPDVHVFRGSLGGFHQKSCARLSTNPPRRFGCLASCKRPV